MVDVTEDPFYSTSAVADMFGVKPYTVRAWITEGKIKAVKIHNQHKIRKSEINRFANETFGNEEENDDK